MASSDVSVQRVATYDARAVAPAPRYAVAKSMEAISTNRLAPTGAASASQMTFSIPVPGKTAFVDREFILETKIRVQFTLTFPVAPAPGTQLCVMGRDIAPRPFPFASILSAASLDINDTSFPFSYNENVASIFELMGDFRQVRQLQMTPYKMDKTQIVADGSGSLVSSVGSYVDAPTVADVPNGSLVDWNWLFSNGTVAAAGADPAAAEVTFAAYGDGTFFPTASGAPAAANRLCLEFKVWERIPLFPLAFADSDAVQGMYNIASNMTLNLNINSTAVQRIFRSNPLFTGSVTSANLLASAAFSDTRLNVTTLRPTGAYEASLPSDSVVPIINPMQYVGTVNPGPVAPGATVSLATSSTNLNQIPDLIALWVAPQSDSYTTIQGDYRLPITSLSVNFQGRSGLGTTMSEHELFRLSQRNGLNMDWQTWMGRATSVPAQLSLAGKYLATTGPVLLFSVSDLGIGDLTTGITGSWEFQAVVTVENRSQLSIPNLKVNFVALNSGFMVSNKDGHTTRFLGPLTMAEALTAPAEETRSSLARFYGRGVFDRIGSYISKGKSFLKDIAPLVGEVKKVAATHGGETGKKAASLLESLGYGRPIRP